jgi:hypothetical protein
MVFIKIGPHVDSQQEIKIKNTKGLMEFKEK